MIKHTLIIVLLGLSNWVCGQTHYFSDSHPKNLSFQVAPTLVSYGEYAFYGYQIGLNYKEVLSVNYFHTRDYESRESYMDSRWAGLYTAVIIPASENLGIGPVYRLLAFNGKFQKPYMGIEARFDVSWNLKFGLEFGKSSSEAAVFKLIWNLY